MSENNTGLIKSSITGEDIEPVFDYDVLTESDRRLLAEILRVMEEKKGKPTSVAIADLKMKFNLAEVPMLDIKKSLWYEFTKDERIGPSVQGFRETKDKDGNPIRIPHIGFSADLDYLDAMINRIILKGMSLQPAKPTGE